MTALLLSPSSLRAAQQPQQQGQGQQGQGQQGQGQQGQPPAQSQQQVPQQQAQPAPWDNDPDGATEADIANAIQNEFGNNDYNRGDEWDRNSDWARRQRAIGLARKHREEELEEISKLTENATFAPICAPPQECPKKDEKKNDDPKKDEPKKDESKKDDPKKGTQSLDVAPKDAPKTETKPITLDDVTFEPSPAASGPFVADPVPDSVAAPGAPIPHRLTVFTIGRGGEVEAHIYSDHALTTEELELAAGASGIIMPASGAVAAALRRLQSDTVERSGIHVTTVAMRAYCVEARKPAASVGATYVWASELSQRQFSSGRLVRRVAEALSGGGYLRPLGDPTDYGRFIAQYAIWARLEHWDQARFTDEFIARTRQEFSSSNKAWTHETELTLRALAPARWADVSRVLSTSTKVESRLRTVSVP